MSLDCKVTIRSESQDDYEQLKNCFCNLWNSNATSNTLKRVLKEERKSDVRDLINSQRCLDSVCSIVDLLKILERRDALSKESPQILRTIAMFSIDNDHGNLFGLEAMKIVEKYMNEHQIAHGDGSPTSIKLNYKVKYIDIQRQHHSQSLLASPRQEVEILDDTSIENCLRYLCANIGSEWTEFVRALPNLNEDQFNCIRSRHHKNNVKAIVRDCLQHSIHVSGPEQCNKMTFIKIAVECGRRDIANDLMSC